MSEQLIVTGSPKTTIKAGNTGVSQLNHPFLNRQSQGTQQTGVMPHYGGGAEKCARCSKNVYLAEKKVGAGRSFHSSCFSCQTCNRKLDATTLSEHKGEIFCKTCYTRQFGMHGLVSGVTMTTEQPVREVRHSRRSSYGSDLDAPVITHEKARPRAHSNDNMLRSETSGVIHDELPKMFPWRNDVIPEQQSPPKTQNTNGIDHLVDQQYQRPISQIGFGKVLEATLSEQKEITSPSHINGTSAIIDMPIISPPKRVDSHIEPIEMPTVPTRNNERSRSPSPVSTDIYERKNSHEHQTDISDNFARLTLNEINSRLYANENLTMNKIASENPVLKQTYSHENKQPNSYDSSPSTNVNNYRSPSPTNNQEDEIILRDSPPSAYVPQHDYLSARSSNSNVLDRQPSSPSKTNNLPSPLIGGKYSTISALIKPHRPLSQLNSPLDD